MWVLLELGDWIVICGVQNVLCRVRFLVCGVQYAWWDVADVCGRRCCVHGVVCMYGVWCVVCVGWGWVVVCGECVFRYVFCSGWRVIYVLLGVESVRVV